MHNGVLTGAVLLLCAFVVFAQTNPDEIKSLPGYTQPISFKQYSGYLQSNATNNRNLFYWFVESQRAPATDPVLLWLVRLISNITHFSSEWRTWLF